MNSVDINALKEKLRQGVMPVQVAAVYIYGSFVKGRLRGDSDIDIALLASYDADAAKRLELISQVEGIISHPLRDRGFRQEISVTDLRGKYIPVSLQYKIITEGILLYEGDKNQRIDFENAAKGEYFDFEPFLKMLRRRKHGDIFQKA